MYILGTIPGKTGSAEEDLPRGFDVIVSHLVACCVRICSWDNKQLTYVFVLKKNNFPGLLFKPKISKKIIDKCYSCLFKIKNRFQCPKRRLNHIWNWNKFNDFASNFLRRKDTIVLWSTIQLKR